MKFVSFNSTPDQPPRKKRPGPVGFSGENASSINLPIAKNEGIGMALSPKKETPSGSKELRVNGPIIYAIVGIIVSLAGIVVLEPMILLVGMTIEVFAYGVHRMNTTQRRIRNTSREISGDTQ